MGLGLQGKRWNRPIEIDRNRPIDFDLILTIASPAGPATAGRPPRNFPERTGRPSATAYARGVFGVPGFACGDDVFFGDDRLDLLPWTAAKRAGAKAP
jgi:hypothetical protein